MAGAGKRRAGYVPVPFRYELDRLSKADLMELLWDQAMIATGYADTADPIDVMRVILQSHDALHHAGWQSSVKLRGEWA